MGQVVAGGALGRALGHLRVVPGSRKEGVGK